MLRCVNKLQGQRIKECNASHAGGAHNSTQFQTSINHIWPGHMTNGIVGHHGTVLTTHGTGTKLLNLGC